MSYYIRKNGVTKKLVVIPEGYPAELIGYDNTGTNLQSDNAQDAITELYSGKVSKSGDTMNGALIISNSTATQLELRRNHSETSLASSIAYIGNNIPEGTVGCSDGILRIYGKGAYYTGIEAPNSTANRKITIPDKSGTIALEGDVVAKTGDTMTGALTINATEEVQIEINRSHTNTTSQPTRINIGNNTADGTAGSCYGRIRLYGKGSKYTTLEAPNSTSNRVITLPNAAGTLALLETAVNKTVGSFNGNSSVNYTFATTGVAYLLVSTWNAAAMWIIKAEASNVFIFEVYNSDNNFSCTKNGSTITITNNHAQGGNYMLMF